MHRRDFIKYLLATPIAAELDIEKLLWVPEKKIFLPAIQAIDWGADPAYIESLNVMYLLGIPYHHLDATTGEWLGIRREPDWRNGRR